MNVILYTINDTESDFCKQAKDFLTAHNIPFENKDVEHDRTALSAMLAISDNFSGVPVMVVGEGADQKVVKGFTQEEFEQALGLSVQPEVAPVAPIVQDSVPAPTQWPTGEQKLDQNIAQVDQNAAMPAAAPVMPPVASVTPPAPVEPLTPMQSEMPAAPAWNNEPATTEPVTPVEPLTAPVEPSAPAWNNEPAAPVTPVEPAHDDELKGIMDTLSQNGMPSTPAVEPAAVEPVSAPSEFTAPAVNPEPIAPVVTPAPAVPEPSTWANQPASAHVAPAWSSEPAVTPEPVAPISDMPSVPDFPQK